MATSFSNPEFARFPLFQFTLGRQLKKKATQQRVANRLMKTATCVCARNFYEVVRLVQNAA
jgi:hypothetical protein